MQSNVPSTKKGKPAVKYYTDWGLFVWAVYDGSVYFWDFVQWQPAMMPAANLEKLSDYHSIHLYQARTIPSNESIKAFKPTPDTNSTVGTQAA